MRHSRWYDAYPRLAFALQLLRLAPQRHRTEAMAALSSLLDEMTGPLVDDALFAMADAPALGPGAGERWYDDPAVRGAEVTMARLKAAPGRVKRAAADRLLDGIDRCA